MTSEADEILMSQLADGELTSDQVNDLLLKVLDDPAGREELKQMLTLRQATAVWRNRQPDRPVMVVADRPTKVYRGHRAWQLGGLAAAACIGGVLVLAGIWAAGLMSGSGRLGQQAQIAQGPVAAPAATRVTAAQMQQVAEVFALHESVAGPLAYYAADDQNSSMAPVRGAGAPSRPIAMILKLGPTSAGGKARTYVIVCRDKEPTAIELPAESPNQGGLRVYLTPQAVDGHVDVQYAISVEGDKQRPVQASLGGERRVGLTETSLGQLAMGDRLVNVEASAWRIRQENK